MKYLCLFLALLISFASPAQETDYEEEILSLLKKYESAIQAMGDTKSDEKAIYDAKIALKNIVTTTGIYVYNDLDSNATDTSFIYFANYVTGIPKDYPLGLSTKLNYSKTSIKPIAPVYERNVYGTTASIMKMVVYPVIKTQALDSLVLTPSESDSTIMDTTVVNYSVTDTIEIKKVLPITFYIQATKRGDAFSDFKIYGISPPKIKPKFRDLPELEAWWVTLDKKWKEVFKKQLNLEEIADPYYLQRVKSVRELSLEEIGVTNLEPLKQLTQLEKLECQNIPLKSLAPLTPLTNLYYLDISKTGIDTLAGIENMKYLEVFICTDNELEHINQLASLEKLKEVNLSDNNIEDFSPLNNASLLEKVNITGNKCTDISFVKGKFELTEVIFAKNFVEDITPLTDMENLVVLNCYNNPITTLQPIAKSHKLMKLNVGNTKITSLDPIKHLRFLTILNLDDSGISDFSALSNFTLLTELYLSDSNISDLGPVMGLDNLQKLYMARTKISLKEKDRFKKKHPRCQLLYY